jgi:hypothetical protein
MYKLCTLNILFLDKLNFIILFLFFLISKIYNNSISKIIKYLNK